MNQDEAHGMPARAGVLLINLGTPAAPTKPAIRGYLRQFLSDPRVVELPRWLWLPILYGFILPFRPGRLVDAYGKVWTSEGSPLMAISRRQHAALAQRFGEELPVELAMTYGSPSVSAALERLDRAGVRRLIVLPLYPQYSATTTAAAMDQLFSALRASRWLPELRTIHQYHDEPAYIDALANVIQTHWQAKGRGNHLLMSFHSIPRKCLERGDPYFCQAHKTARLLAEALDLSDQDWSISFQSRIGRQPWLQPYTDFVVKQLASRGVRKLDVVCPGFAADCLETLEEVAIRYDEDFRSASGEKLVYIDALNDSAAHIDALEKLIRNATEGWMPSVPSPDALARRRLRVQQIEPSLDSPTLL